MKPPKTINVEWLEQHHVCKTHRKSFQRVWKEEMPVTKENIESLASLRFNMNTLLQFILPPKLSKEFVKQRRLLKKELRQKQVEKLKPYNSAAAKVYARNKKSMRTLADYRAENAEIEALSKAYGVHWSQVYPLQTQRLKEQAVEFLWNYWDNWYEYEDYFAGDSK